MFFLNRWNNSSGFFYLLLKTFVKQYYGCYSSLTFFKNLIIFYAFTSFLTFAQGENLLIQQYNKGPALDDVYSRWTIYLGSRLNYLNTDLEGTNPILSLGGLTEVQLNISRTFGFIIGFGNTAISYKYDYQNSFANDRLNYFVLPIGVRLNPTKKVSFSFGALYNFLTKVKIRLVKIIL